ncbi:MAG: hypothetical protein OEV29_10160 [Thermoleophilia bacterium]|nr:hypothetical protein [Thermoleophilia bacterium]
MQRPLVTVRQVVIAGASFAALCLVGAIGSALISVETPFDALYRTIITVYTAGLVSAPDNHGAKLLRSSSSAGVWVSFSTYSA